MDSSLARFRDLRGIGPATEARLHAAGIHTWDALAVAATALAAVRGHGETRRDVADAVAARRSGHRRGGPSAAVPAPHDRPAAGPRSRRQPAPRTPPSSHHVVVLDAGKAIGGGSRDISFVVTDPRSADGEFGYRATLAARAFGHGRNGSRWTTLASRAGRGRAPGKVVLAFGEVQLPPGIHRLELRMDMLLPAPTSRPPALRIA